ncbi:MAG: glycosyltransferase family 4 protein [Pseudomonadota bacterium]
MSRKPFPRHAAAVRVLFVSSLYAPHEVGGAEASLRAVAQGLGELGHDIHVATLRPKQDSAPPLEHIDGVTVHRCTLANIYWPWATPKKRDALSKGLWHLVNARNPWMARRLERLTFDVQPDVVVTGNLQGWSTAVFDALATLDVPVVHVANDYALACVQTALFRNGRKCGVQDQRCASCRFLTGRNRRYAHRLAGQVSVSQSIEDFHRAHDLLVGREQTVIHNPLKPDVRIARRARSRRTPARFGFLGRIEKSKGIETALRAMQILNERGVEAQFHIAGRAPDEAYVDDLTSRLPVASARYVGYVDAQSFLDSIDCLVFPSEWLEALGNSAIEAFARGVPVIGSTAGGIPESVQHGENGYLFEPGNAATLADHMQTVATKPEVHAQLSANALTVAGNYLPEHRAHAYAQFLAAIVDQHGGGAGTP